ncbi:MAG: hypothetical protein A3B37_01810 [Candidatus Sungbacteria bacterium RIFCSPLOWO2_01_FULL_59_16]|uniref:EamA domain-containing protein n=1 Tax=Candidatus Sungbacteria bacterium RIFCSPLOWO2_01_FULL_59_16 TaxID=1802280 RepID=A0A1G2LAC7_9BACT|nr:MAG: hypothetical protein A3B37_01810 [Candidatus Sungbacteria bacterium RIFCSPLOWO2_01_FULL_59_16]
MELLAVSLMVAAAVAFALSNVSQRWVLREKVLGVNSFLFSRLGVTAAVSFLLVPFWGGWDTPFQQSPKIFWISVVATGLINGIAIQVANAKASGLAEASLITPIQALTPGLVAIAALGLGEWLLPVEVVGVALIALFNYIHGREDATTLREYLLPFTFLRLPANYDQLDRRKREEARDRTLGLRWAYVSAGCGTIGLIFDGLLARNGNVILGIACKWLVASACVAPRLFRASESAERAVAEFRKMRKRPRGRFEAFAVVACGITLGVGELFSAVAFRVAPIAFVGGLKRLMIPLTALFALSMLREEKAKRRIWPAIGIAVGSALLAFGGATGKLIRSVGQLLE